MVQPSDRILERQAPPMLLRSVAVVDLSGNALTQALSQRLFDDLKQIQVLDEVLMVKADSLPLVGSLAPDWFVCITSDKARAKTIPGIAIASSHVLVSVSRRPLQVHPGSHSYHDGYNYSASAALDVKHMGLITRSALWDLPAAELSKRLALTEHFDEWIEISGLRSPVRLQVSTIQSELPSITLLSAGSNPMQLCDRTSELGLRLRTYSIGPLDDRRGAVSKAVDEVTELGFEQLGENRSARDGPWVSWEGIRERQWIDVHEWNPSSAYTTDPIEGTVVVHVVDLPEPQALIDSIEAAGDVPNRDLLGALHRLPNGLLDHWAGTPEWSSWLDKRFSAEERARLRP